ARRSRRTRPPPVAARGVRVAQRAARWLFRRGDRLVARGDRFPRPVRQSRTGSYPTRETLPSPRSAKPNGAPVPFQLLSDVVRGVLRAGQPVESCLGALVLWSTWSGRAPRRVCRDGSAVGSPRFERQYRG